VQSLKKQALEQHGRDRIHRTEPEENPKTTPKKWWQRKK
jgi:hypothetical protein